MSSASSTSTAFPTSTGFPDNGPPQNGIGAGVYYAAIGVAVAIIASITILSRVLYARKLRAINRRRDAAERSAMERRGEGQGLPTYFESRHQGMSMGYAGPPPPGALDDDAPEEERVRGWTSWTRHFPSLPGVLHIRREEQPHDLPQYQTHGDGPPKYEIATAHDAPPPSPFVPAPPEQAATRDSTTQQPQPATQEMSQSLPTSTDLPPPLPGSATSPQHVIGEADAEPNPWRDASSTRENEEGFMHPEERRRYEADRVTRGS